MREASPAQAYEFGEFLLYVDEQVLKPRRGSPVQLTRRVFATLLYLVEHAGRVVTKEALMDAVWPDVIVEENNLAQNISTLRRIFGDTPGSQRYIVTVPGRGYRFAPDVTSSGNGSLKADSDRCRACTFNKIPVSNTRRPGGDGARHLRHRFLFCVGKQDAHWTFAPRHSREKHRRAAVCEPE